MHPLLSRVLLPVGVRALLLHERLRTGVAFNPLSAAMRTNPYPAYRHLRSRDPVHRSNLARGWVLTRYADCAAVLRDPRFSARRVRPFAGSALPQDPAQSPFVGILSTTMLFLDPPDHTRLRTLVSMGFTPRAVAALRPRIEAIVGQLLADAPRNGTIDIVADLAYPLPLTVIAELLGVAAADRARFKRWSDLLLLGIEPLIDRPTLRRVDRATREMRDYFRMLIADRRRRPRDDLVSALAAVEQAGDRLSEQELLAMCIALLVAGHETTTSLIGNALLALLRHPDEQRRLRDDPTLTANAVEECLRYDSPVQMTTRVATADVALGGRTIRRGDLVLAVVGAANRDPAVFADPDRLDLARPAPRHLSFGLGSHFCLGAPLARLEAQIALRALVERFPDLRLAAQPRWQDSLTVRGVASLPVAV